MTTLMKLDEIKMEMTGSNQETVKIIENISVNITRGKFISIIGPSGCGKSTLFNIIAGLLRPSTGSIYLNDNNITGEIGHVSYMLQKDLLFPWLTVLENVTLGMKLNGVPKKEAIEAAVPILKKYGLGGFENSYPKTLSGGMKQRVALMRTILHDKDIILLDEPLSALDAQTRYSIQMWLMEIWRDLEKTMLLVTHDIDEAIFLSDEIYVLSKRPTTIAECVHVSLPRPRDEKIFSTSEFASIRRHLVALLSNTDRATA